MPQGDAKQGAAGEGVSLPPGGKRSAQRRHGAEASGIEARRGETPKAAQCAARKPGPAGEMPKAKDCVKLQDAAR